MRAPSFLAQPAEQSGAAVPEFRDVYGQNVRYVWKLLRRLGAKEDVLEDLTHDVFTAAFRHWAEYDARRPLRPWLYGFCVRILLDQRRRRASQLEVVGEVADARAAGDDPVEAVQRREGLSLAQQIISQLELERRVVFVLAELEQLEMPDIAQALGIPLNTAYSRLRLARRDFNAAVKRLHAKEGAP